MEDKKKMGRPTTNPKKNRLELRMSDGDMEMLNVCSDRMGLSKTDIIRLGIEKVYNEINRR